MVVATQKYTTVGIGFKVLVAHSVREILDDPDYGLELTEGFKKKLHSAQGFKGGGTPLSKIRNKYY